MGHHTSFNQAIHSILFLSFILSSVSFFSCQEDEFEMSQNAYLEIKAKVEHASKENLTVDGLEYGKKVCTVSFSNDDILVIPIDYLTVLTIDFTGLWCLNQDRNHLIQKSDEAIKTCCGDTKICIVEGYTDWTFVLHDDYAVIFTKSLFSYDADAIMKGVNHRGYSKTAPENTLPAYRLSKLHGFNCVETDIQFTSDGIPVLLHDESIDRTSNGQGKIQNMSLSEVRSFDFGSWKDPSFRGTQIPTLEEFLSLCAELGLSPHLELKAGTRDQVFQIIDLVEQFGLTKTVTFISFNHSLLKFVLERLPDACVGLLARTVDESVITKACSMSTKDNYVYVGASDYSETAVSLCEQAGLPLGVWVVDSKEIILKLPGYISSVSSNYLHAGRVLREAARKDEGNK